MPDLLLELFSEEIPARMQPGAAEALAHGVTSRLADAGIPFASTRTFVTPRRVTLIVEELPERRPDVTEERRGPQTTANERALQGFLASTGLATLDACEVRTVGNAQYYYLVRTIAGGPAVDALPAIVTETIAAFPWPKSMRWSGPPRWVRPLRGIACVFGDAVVDVELPELGLRAGDVTYGHRFLAPGPLRVTAATYVEALRGAYVVADRDERKRIIEDGIAQRARAHGVEPVADPALVDEVCGLVEWPVPLVAAIDARYMTLPREVLRSTMRGNQKYFSLSGADGEPAPRFAVVANMAAEDGGAAIVAGNERVLRARLSDAAFFWDQDRKLALEAYVPRLSGLVFHEKLGTVADKVARLEPLAEWLASALGASAADAAPGDDAPSRARRAAHLCKADLVTGMVREFPELQGAMGRYYALHAGEPLAVADALRDHYAPLGPSDACPTAPVSVAVALADKLDTLVGFFAIDEKPTGSRDPYALRRAALGAIRLIVENGLRLALLDAFARAHALYRAQEAGARNATTFVARDLLAFVAERLRALLRERGVRHDLVAAVFALDDEDDLVRLLARVDALGAFLASDDGGNLLTAFKRANNIVRREERADKTRYDAGVDPALLRQPEERALVAALEAARAELDAALAGDRFADAMAALARLRAPVDAFFDAVTVNAPEPALRRNRLALLTAIGAALRRVADFTRIEG